MRMTGNRIEWLKNLMNSSMCGCPVKKPDIKPYSWLQDKNTKGMANQTRGCSKIQMFRSLIIKRTEHLNERVNTITTGNAVNRLAYQKCSQLYVQPIN